MQKNNYFIQIFRDFIKKKDNEFILTSWVFNYEGNLKPLDQLNQNYTYEKFDDYHFCCIGKFIDLDLKIIKNSLTYMLTFEISEIIGMKLNLSEKINIGKKIYLIISSKYADKEHYKGIEIFNLIKYNHDKFTNKSEDQYNFIYLEPYISDDDLFVNFDNIIHWIPKSKINSIDEITEYLVEKKSFNKLNETRGLK